MASGNHNSNIRMCLKINGPPVLCVVSVYQSNVIKTNGQKCRCRVYRSEHVNLYVSHICIYKGCM